MKPRKMKDSGIKWIGRIPVGWELKKLKFLAHMKSGDALSASKIDENGDFPVYGGNGIRGYTDKYTHDGYHLLIGRQGALCGNIHKIRGRFWASEHAIVVTLCGNYSGGWLYYLLSAMNLNQYSESAAQPGISVDRVQNLHISAPKLLKEQEQIAIYLDKRCGEIDRVIAGKERQNKLLKEQRTAIIQEAVTKGLNPKAKLKDSGIDWIGKVPVGWEVRKIKTLFKVIGGATPSSRNPEYWDGDILWVTPADMLENEIYLLSSKRQITLEGLVSCATEIVSADSIIVSNRAPIGKIALAGIPLCTNQGCKGLVSTKPLISKYIYYFLSTQTEPLNMLGQGTTFMELSSDALKNFIVPVPSFTEQEQIASYLDEKCGEIDRVVKANEGMVEKLKEYRRSLIWEAVTGKLAV